jgi:heat shock protein HtpX
VSSAGSILKTIGVFTFVFVLMWAIAALLGALLSAWSIGWFIAWSAAALAVNLFTYFLSDRIALWSHRVRLVGPQEAPQLHAIVEEVAREAGIPKPRVGIMQEPSPNAFATGRNPKHAVVVCTTGLLGLLNPHELKGVLAHEVSHVSNRDTLVMTAVATIAAFLAYAIQFGGRAAAARQRNIGMAIAIILLSYIGGMLAAILIRMFVSRRREFKADATGAHLLGDATGLQNALLKLDYATRQVPMRTAKASTAHLFIANPFGSAVSGLFASHPPIPQRIERLSRLQG